MPSPAEFAALPIIECDYTARTPRPEIPAGLICYATSATLKGLRAAFVSGRASKRGTSPAFILRETYHVAGVTVRFCLFGGAK